MTSVVRASARVMLQVSLEAEVTDFLERVHYQRGARKRPGYRNGYEHLTWRTAEGPVVLARPQVRGTPTPFTSTLLNCLAPRSAILEALALRACVRGLSVRDVAGDFTEPSGAPLLSKSTVSSLTQTLNAHFDAWRCRDLASLPILYLILDAIFLSLQHGSQEKEGVLCAYGIVEFGRKVLLYLALGNRESYDI